MKRLQDNENKVELKILGLELSEELWRKKCEEQKRELAKERKRLDAWEERLSLKERQDNPTRTKSAQPRKRRRQEDARASTKSQGRMIVIEENVEI